MPVPAFRSRPAPPSLRSDADLVHACIEGDQSSWHELVDRYGRLVWSVARRYGLTESDAEEVFQNVFLIVYRKLASLRAPDRLAGWLVRTANRECYRVGALRRPASEADPDLQAAHGWTESEHLAAWERRQIVRDGLRSLGGRCEALLTALFLAPGQPNYRAIAEELHMQVGSIGPTRARCFARLQQILMDMGLDPDSAS